MLNDSSIRKSLDNYVQHRMQEIPQEIKETFLKTKQIWKCENEIDFLYGYYVGKLEEGALHFLLKASRASAGGYVDSFEIRGIIETHRKELRNLIEKSITTAS
ncbi:MAG: hypothetical protein GTN97_04560 [Nitrosopumilaceae archaeon]|nr:hypothetical protein [Nitrosopumilaceae archaeon]NIP10311.1 hypothetical protein [Nitrosopumilaceae archaeon]NIS95174.1 hypothetical protein [Nitrosopumilaceae archaeon]